MVNENYSNFTSTRPNKGFYDPDQPENHREEGKEARAREKKASNSLSFLYCGPSTHTDA